MTGARLFAVLLFCAASAFAETLPPETARMLAGRGDILPLAEVLRRLDIEDEVIGVALHWEDGRYSYRIKAIGAGGQYREYRVDAQSGIPFKQ